MKLNLIFPSSFAVNVGQNYPSDYCRCGDKAVNVRNDRLHNSWLPHIGRKLPE